jgi:hypothetical protein
LPIFGDICQFSAEKIGVFLRQQCYDQILAKTGSSLSKKLQYFCKIFLQKYLKNRDIGPGLIRSRHFFDSDFTDFSASAMFLAPKIGSATYSRPGC